MINYSTIKEMIKCVDDMLESGQYVVNGWEENNYYVLEIATGREVAGANFTLKLPMPR